MRIRVATLDPSLRNFAIVTGWLETDTGDFTADAFHITNSVVETGKTVRNNSKDLASFRLIYNDLTRLLQDVVLVFAEVPHGSQNARAQVSYGGCVALLATIQKPLIEVSANEVKRIIGLPKPSKKDVILWAQTRYPKAPWYLRYGECVNSKNEHVADAIAALHAGLQTEAYRSLITMLRATVREGKS